MSKNQDLSKRLVASFLQFLNDEMNAVPLDSDKAESIDVACQCLRMAYTATAEDVPASQKRLIDVFNESCPAPPEREPLSDEQRQHADKLKQQGNDFMKTESYDSAIECYTKSIAIDPSNAVYYCNRAAAYTGKQKFDLSITDCKKSLEIDPNYSKAYSRMGLTYSKMEMYDEAIDCYKKALELDPDNDGYKKNLVIAEEKQKSQQMPPMNSAMPGMENLGGMGNMLNNPMFMDMAKQVMENPVMQQMAAKMMSGLMNESAGSSSAAPTPDMSQLLEMGQQFAQRLSTNNPELVEQLRNQIPRSEATPRADGDNPSKSDNDAS